MPRIPRYDSPTVNNSPLSIPQASPVGPDAFGAGLGKGLAQVATVAVDYATQQQNEQLKIEKKQQEDLAKMVELRDTNKAKNLFLDMENTLSVHEQALVDDPETPPEKYPDAITTKGNELLADIRKQVPEKIWLQMEPNFREQVYKSRGRMYINGQKEIDDQSWAEELAAADALVNNPNKLAADKIAILKSPEFFASSGRSEVEIEKEREQRINVVVDGEVKAMFNGARNNIDHLKEVKDLLGARNKDGSYTYIPEMQQTRREEYVSSVDGKIEVQQHLAEAEAKRKQAEARQYSQELITEYREKVNSGWMPNTADDYRFVGQVKRAASASPSLFRQYNDAYTRMTSFASREKFRAEDPLGTAAAEKGIVLPPLNVMAPMGPQLEARARIAGKLGVRSLFKGDELNAWGDRIKGMDANGQVTALKDLSGQLGTWSSSTLSVAAEQIKGKDIGTSTLFKLASTGDMHAVKMYATGQEFLRSEKKDLLQQKVTVIKEKLEEKLTTSLGMAMQALPQSRDAVKNATAIAYIGAATSQSIPLDKVDTKLLADVQKRIIGETVPTGKQWMGTSGSWKTTIVPKGMTGDQFLNGIKAITSESIKHLGGIEGMDDTEAADYLKKTAWHEHGPGYGFYKDGKMLMNKKSGKAFLLSWGW